MNQPNTIHTLIEDAARRTPDATALRAPDRPSVSYRVLFEHVTRAAAGLEKRGLRRDDVIAVVLPNGPEMATAFLCATVACICAPLNPSYRDEEFEFYLTDLPARALMIAGLADSPARDVARRLGIQIIELEWSDTDPAGMFSFDAENNNSAGGAAPAPHDVALVLHTSGTTSRPKIVPLTHANLCASAEHITGTLGLTADDVCLNVMPLFHIHGLVAALLSSFRAGGSVVCAPGFVTPSFFDWLTQFSPTWYTAVPTMHASIVARAQSHSKERASHSLRFIRSSSAALPRATLAQLEELFGVPVVEAYGMTEAAHQMASNPLPPLRRKPGTVGLPAGPQISILDPQGAAVPKGSRGEIAIRGPNVTSGYVRNPAANAAAFTDGWLRTGDEGSFDDDGYLTILGRLKEVINRGGEKISPLEVDDVILSHPAVAHAVTFAAKDALLGEEVAAAVVLRPGMEVSERQMREFVGARLIHFKVPRTIRFLDAIPTGPTGKMQRIGLADRLGVSFEARRQVVMEFVSPRTPVEEILASIWSSVMAADPPGVHDNFFDAGGDSTLAAQLIARVRDMLAVDISLIAFFDAPTVAGLAAVVEEVMAGE